MPCHNEADNLPILVEELQKAARAIVALEGERATLHCIFIDDGSTDATLDTLRHLKLPHSHAGADDAINRLSVHYLSFSRNFGKEAALYAGLKKGVELDCDFLAVMDADLQDPPALLPEMLRILCNADSDIDAVATFRSNRTGEPPLRSFFARQFYGFFNKVSPVKMRSGARDYRMMTRRVAQAIIDMPENLRFSKGLFSWVGFKTEWLPYENVPRKEGRSSWSFSGLARYAMEGMLSFSTAPLEMLSLGGLAITMLSIVLLIAIIVRACLFGDPVAGWPSLACLLTFFSGINLLAIAVVGLYVSRIYVEVKGRPLYIVAEEG